MPISKNEITKEMLEKAMQCNTAEDLIARCGPGSERNKPVPRAGLPGNFWSIWYCFYHVFTL